MNDSSNETVVQSRLSDVHNRSGHWSIAGAVAGVILTGIGAIAASGWVVAAGLVTTIGSLARAAIKYDDADKAKCVEDAGHDPRKVTYEALGGGNSADEVAGRRAIVTSSALPGLAGQIANGIGLSLATKRILPKRQDKSPIRSVPPGSKP